MGMSIDGHIGVIEDLKSTMSVCMSEPEKTEICTSLSVAIDVMRKYQKIEQILKNIPYGGEVTVRRIQEVVEDGNDS